MLFYTRSWSKLIKYILFKNDCQEYIIFVHNKIKNRIVSLSRCISMLYYYIMFTYNSMVIKAKLPEQKSVSCKSNKCIQKNNLFHCDWNQQCVL